MNLPHTDFPMRGNLAKNEPVRLQWWQEHDIYGAVLEHNRDGEPFVLHDGPPYANGPIHIGHAFNKILKDFVIKAHAQRGYYTPYIPGWDCHGQPIEHIVEEKLGPEKMAQIDKPTLRRLCHEYAEKCVDTQREGFKRLGVNADWDHPYLTFQHEFEAGNVEIFKKMYLDGSVYRGRKPVHWCKHCHTALAEAEIEYGNETSPSIFVNFKLKSVPEVYTAAGVDPSNAYVLIWTTTPWTLPANTAVCMAPAADYAFVEAGGKFMLFALDLVEEVAKTAGWESYRVVEGADGKPVTLKGTELEGIKYEAPIKQDFEGTIIYGDHVTLDSGTGAVHTAPGHGQDDYIVGMKFNVPLLMPVDADGRLTEEAAPFQGLDTDEANPKIIEWLRERGTLVAHVDIDHSYPHCWRCHEPVIFRATDQWFVSMDQTGLRANALDAIENEVRWIPEWAKNRIGSMVADRPDWCISRQRSWGVPIPVFRCKKCGSTVATAETFDAVIDLFNNEGADAWYIKQPKDYLPAGTKCEVCGCDDLDQIVPENDILDVWWESGVTHTSVCKKRDVLHFPAEMYLEGSDQHRGWFQSSLLTSVGAYGVPPYKSVMHCGFTVDEQGRKMSKSLGNGVDPAEVIGKYGADVLRLWVSSVDYSQDVRISDDILKQVSDTYRRFRNTFRFLLGNLSDFDDAADSVEWSQLTQVDQWAMVRLAKLLDDVTTAYEGYAFHQVYRSIYEYVIGDLSAVYLDTIKDRLYSEAPASPRRRAAQTVLANILEVLVRVLTPILAFTTEEVWQNYPEAMRSHEGRPFSVQLAGWPDAAKFSPQIPEGEGQKVAEAFEHVLTARDVVTKALEEARGAKAINKSQEAAVKICAPADVCACLKSLAPEALEELLIVSKVQVVEGDELAAEVSATDLEKCPRCWNHRELLAEGEHAGVCARCAEALEQI